MAHRPRERIGHHGEPGVWLGALCWPTHPAERDERQPVRSPADHGRSFAIVLDGRIDNRSDLRRRLSLPRERMCGDAMLVLHAYRRWGLSAFVRIIGDYALVLFDGARRTLVAARDPAGVRPLFYSLTDDRAWLASEPAALRALGAGGEPDEDSVVERLLNTVNGNDRTLYRGIRRLPPAHLLLVTPTQQRVTRFHDWRDVRPLSTRVEGDCVQLFRDTFSEAVRCRLDGADQAALELSGGLDSSSICVLAGQQPQPPALFAQSLVFPGLPCDERPFIRAVVAHTQLPHEEQEATPLTIDVACQQAARDHDVPAYPNGVMSRGLRLSAQRRGARVVLSGSGADEWWTGSRLHVAERLRRGQWLAAVQAAMAGIEQAAARHDRWARPPDIANTLRLGIGPWLPWSFRQRYHQRRARKQGWPWIEPALLARTEAWSRLHQPPRRERGSDWAAQDVIDIVEAGWVFHAYEMEAREAASYGLEVRLPFTDRRLCELALSLPLNLRTRDAGTKTLLRQAMRGDAGWRGLPEMVRTRRSKAEFSHLYLQALREGERQLKPQPLRVAARGWVDATKYWRAVAAVLSRARWLPGGWVVARQDCTAAQLLWGVMALELWLRSAQPT